MEVTKNKISRSGNNSGGSGVPPTPPAAPPDNHSSLDDSDPERDWNDPAARKRYLKNKINACVAKAFRNGTQVVHTSEACLPPKKSILPKAFTGVPDELDDYLLKIENVFTLDNAHYSLDLNKIYYAAGLLEGQAAEWYKNVHLLVIEEAALQERNEFDRKLVSLTWKHFPKASKSSFGRSLTWDRGVL